MPAKLKRNRVGLFRRVKIPGLGKIDKYTFNPKAWAETVEAINRADAGIPPQMETSYMKSWKVAL